MRFLVLMILMTLPIAGAASGLARAEAQTVGRVRVTPIVQESSVRARLVRDVLEGKYAPGPGEISAMRRVLSVRPRQDDASRFDVTIFDYEAEQGFDLVVDAKGTEISRRATTTQWEISDSELADAQAIASTSSVWSSGIASGTHQVYPAMPPVTTDPTGRRLVNIGILSDPDGGFHLAENEVISVDIPAGKITRYASGAPDTSRSSLLACNPPPSSGCGASVGTCNAAYHVEWPAANPVWKFDVRHPTCTDSVQGQGTGLELTKVYYGSGANSTLILERAEVPVLNVKYQNDSCGPYRDWLDSENCFSATGTDVAPGIRVTTGNPTPTTFCEQGTDVGNFNGVAIHDQGNALYLLTETQAGWYRYVMEWRLYLDGTIEPIFGFGAVSNGCTCNLHFHHAYWRFEWAIGGTQGNYTTGINTIERRRAGSTDQYDPIATEGKFIRPLVNSASDWFRIRNPQTGMTFVIEPGAEDGNADTDGDGTADTYAKGDLWALAYNTGQIDDPGGESPGTSINIDPWMNSEALGTTKRLVTWYHATYAHNGNEDPEACELAGPRIVLAQSCAGSIGLDQAIYACGATVNVSLDDSDLRGTATIAVGVTSNTETTAENLTLNETPAGSGHFTGSILSLNGPAVHGDGKISAVNGDSISVRYLDASWCGAPNVNVDKSTPVDCAGPGLSNVRAINISSSSATVAWDTNEASTSVVHYGTTPPGGSSSSNPAAVTSHGLTISGLSPCATYYYWVQSADGAGNLTSSNSGGGYYSFRTASASGTPTNYNSTGGPVVIPDNTTVMSTINVADTQAVQDINVTTNITHSYDGDLTLSLVTPTNVSIALSNRRGGSGDNYTNTVFDDEAATSITSGTPPFTGSYRPESPLSVADGIGATGAWKLSVADGAGADTGAITSWKLTLTYPLPCTPTAAPPPVPDGTFGSAMTAVRTDAAGSSMHIHWDASTCAATNYHLLYGPLAGVPSYAIAGGACGLGPGGNYDWTGVPAENLWFTVVGDNGSGTESSWGKSSSGAERGGTTPSGQCGITARNNSATCP